MSIKRIGLLLLWIIALSSCVNDLTLLEMEEFIGAPLPSNAKNIRSYTQVGIDRTVYLRFDLPKDDVLTLLDSLGITSLEDFSTLHNHPSLEWWRPEQAEQTGNYQSANQVINYKGFQILIVELNDDMLVVYLHVAG